MNTPEIPIVVEFEILHLKSVYRGNETLLRKLDEYAKEYVQSNADNLKLKSEEGKLVGAELEIEGKHGPHVTSWENGQWNCDCDMFHGRGKFEGMQGECSHTMTLRILAAEKGHTLLLPSERGPDDPKIENMNNFHGHFPEGIYRPADDPSQGFLREAMSKHLAEFAAFIDKDESEWPEGVDHELVQHVKTKRDIQREIDNILSQDIDLAERWEASMEYFRNGGFKGLREYVLRPFYIKLRERFTKEELSS